MANRFRDARVRVKPQSSQRSECKSQTAVRQSEHRFLAGHAQGVPSASVLRSSSWLPVYGRGIYHSGL